MSIKETIKEKINLEKLKAHPKATLATIAIASLTVGFAGGVGVGKLAATSSQASEVYSPEGTLPPGDSTSQGIMHPERRGGRIGRRTPPDQTGNAQGMTPPDATSDATESTSSNTSSDEVNALKEKNEEIQSQITSSSSSSDQ